MREEETTRLSPFSFDALLGWLELAFSLLLFPDIATDTKYLQYTEGILYYGS